MLLHLGLGIPLLVAGGYRWAQCAATGGTMSRWSAAGLVLAGIYFVIAACGAVARVTG